MDSNGLTFDAIVIGAGFSGLYMLKLLRDKLGLNVRVCEAAETVGGTWYWNRYPGARCDSEAYVYCFTWDKELLQEWEWSERYPEQPEILRYLEHVAQRHDLKRSIQFNTRVTGAYFGEIDEVLLNYRRRHPIRYEHATLQGPGKIPRQMVPYQPVSAGRD